MQGKKTMPNDSKFFLKLDKIRQNGFWRWDWTPYASDRIGNIQEGKDIIKGLGGRAP